MLSSQYSSTENSNVTLLVAALDFGTTYSGYAFSFRGEYEKNPLKIQSNQAWVAGHKQLLSLKTPTTLLLDNDANFKSFGYDAENKYVDIVLDGEEDKHYYFERFKMNLHKNKYLSGKMMLEDVRGRKLPAVNVFSMSIKALKSHLLDLLKQQGTTIKEDEVLWVLTVPAIWDDAAKQFMRHCAAKAGIMNDCLKISLEPEAASIYCQLLPVERLSGASKSFTVCKPGTKYMVIDLGGGTADITVHEKLKDGSLKELHKACGGACGGTAVDQQFLNIFENIFGRGYMTKLRQEKGNITAYMDLKREFETLKRTIEPKSSGKVNITIPFVILNALSQKVHKKDIEKMIELSKYAKNLTLLGDKLRFDAEFAKSLFKPVTDAIVSHVRNVISNASTTGLNMFLMVGGFSECKMTQDAIRKAFPDMRVIIPEDAGLAVLRGAVIFGHRPDAIASRIMKFTYGIKVTPEFDKSKHQMAKKIVVDNVPRCVDVFKPIAKAGTSVPVGHSFTMVHSTIRKMQNAVDLQIYVSPEESPEYVTDELCEKLGTMQIKIPNPTEKDRHVVVHYTFGDTELRMIAMEENEKTPCISHFNII